MMTSALSRCKCFLGACLKYTWDTAIFSAHVFGTLTPFALLNIGGAIKTTKHFTGKAPAEFNLTETILTLGVGSLFALITLIAVTLLNVRALTANDLYNNSHELRKHFRYFNTKPLGSCILWWCIGLITIALCCLNALITPTPMVLAISTSYDLTVELAHSYSNPSNSTNTIVNRLFAEAPIWANFAMYSLIGGFGISITVLHFFRYFFMDTNDLEAQLTLVRIRQHIHYLKMFTGVCTREELLNTGHGLMDSLSSGFLNSIAPELPSHQARLSPTSPGTSRASNRREETTFRHRRVQTAPPLIPSAAHDNNDVFDHNNISHDDPDHTNATATDASTPSSFSSNDMDATMALIAEHHRRLNPAGPGIISVAERLHRKFLISFIAQLKPRPHIKQMADFFSAAVATFAYRGMFYAVQDASTNLNLSSFHFLLQSLGCEYLPISAFWNLANLKAMYEGTRIGLQRLFELYYLMKEECAETRSYGRKTACFTITHLLSSAMILPAFMQAGGVYGPDPTMYFPFGVGYGCSVPVANEVALHLLITKNNRQEKSFRTALAQVLDDLSNELKRIEYDPSKTNEEIYNALVKIRNSEAFMTAIALLHDLGKAQLQAPAHAVTAHHESCTPIRLTPPASQALLARSRHAGNSHGLVASP